MLILALTMLAACGGITSEEDSAEAPACFWDDELPLEGEIQTKLVNHTSSTLYLRGAERNGHLFDLMDPAGNLVVPPSCGPRCTEPSLPGCTGAAHIPSVVVLSPGETLSSTWDGRHWAEQWVPAQCSELGDWSLAQKT